MYQHHLPPRQTMQPRNYHPSLVARRLSPTNFNLNANTYGGNGVGNSNHDAVMSSARTTRRNATIHDGPRSRPTFPRSRSTTTRTRSTFPRSSAPFRRTRTPFRRNCTVLSCSSAAFARTRSTIPRSRTISAHMHPTTLTPRQRARVVHVTRSRAQGSVKTEARTSPGRRRIHHEPGQHPGVEQETETQRQKHQEPRWSDAADNEEALAAHG